MSKSRVTEDELAKTIGLDRADDHPLSIGRNTKPREDGGQPLSTPLGGGFSEELPVAVVDPEVAKATVAASPKPETQVAARRISAARVKQRDFTAPPPTVGEGRAEVSAPKKAELYPRRIGIGMNDELKSELDSLTAQVQALRTVKSQRHTTNTVVRCALKYVLKNIQFYDGDVADTEEELEELFSLRLKR